MRNLVNLTPHEIVLMSGGRKRIFPPDGYVARVEMEYTEEAPVEDHTGEPLPLVSGRLGRVHILPPTDNCIFIVSAMVAQALPDRQDVVCPDTGPTAVRENGQIKAVTRLISYFNYR